MRAGTSGWGKSKKGQKDSDRIMKQKWDKDTKDWKAKCEGKEKKNKERKEYKRKYIGQKVQSYRGNGTSKSKRQAGSKGNRKSKERKIKLMGNSQHKKEQRKSVKALKGKEERKRKGTAALQSRSPWQRHTSALCNQVWKWKKTWCVGTHVRSRGSHKQEPAPIKSVT